MRVLVAGASGAIGQFLIPQLVDAGHEVVGLTRRQAKADALSAAGARGVVVDALDPDALRRVVLDAAPEAVIDQLTSLPADYDLRDPHLYDANDEIRSKGTAALHDAAREAGVRRYVLQSISFLYAPEGDWVKSEDARPWLDAPKPFGRSVKVLIDNEQRITRDPDIAGVALRYGFFYGPGNAIARGGEIVELVRRRRMPIVGAGAGTYSFINLRDAAAATVRALARDATGIFNIVDDSPVRLSEWLPFAATLLGAPAPGQEDESSARKRIGDLRVYYMNEQRGASNAKAKRELGWQPALPSWRAGFEALYN